MSRDLDYYEILRIKRYLRSRSIFNYWRAGEILLNVQGIRKGNGWFKRYAQQLGGSVSTLEHCKRLAMYWTNSDVKLAKQLGLSWRHIIRLIALDGIAARANETERSLIIKERQDLMLQFRKDKLSEWQNKLTSALKRRVLINGARGPKRRALGNGNDYISNHLAQAVNRLNELRLFVPEHCRGDWDKLALNLELQRAEIAEVIRVMLTME